MKILLDLPEDKLSYFSKMSGHTFATINSPIDKDSVGVVVEDGIIENFRKGLAQVSVLNVPVAVIAGSKQASTPFQNAAADYGIPAECVIVKNEENICSSTGHVFGNSRRGISVQILCSICEYVLKSNLCPEILIWEERTPSKTAQVETQESKPHLEVAKRNVNNSGHEKRSPEQPTQDAGRINTEDLDSVLTLAENVIGVFKTTPESNSGAVANKLAKELNAMHLELSEKADSFSYYGNDIKKALQSGHYAFSNCESVQISSRYSGGKYIVVEFDPKASLEVMQDLYSICQSKGKVIHVAPDIVKSKAALQAWLEPGYQLDAIIPESEKIMCELKTYFGDRLCDLDTLINKLR